MPAEALTATAEMEDAPAPATPLSDLEREVIGLPSEPTPPPKTEEETETEEEVPAETETVEPETAEPTPAEEPAKQGRASERIQELIAKNKTLEDRLASLEAKLTAGPSDEEFVPDWAGADDRGTATNNTGRQQTSAEGASSPASERIAQLEGVIRLAAKNPDGMEINGVSHDGTALREARAQAEVELAKLRVEETVQATLAARGVQAAAAQSLEIVRADPEFAWMKVAAAPEHRVVKQMLDQFPEIKRFSNWPQAVAILATGLHKRFSQAGASTGKTGAAAAAPADGAANGVNGKTGTSNAVASPAAAGSGAPKRRPAAPFVGTAVPGSAPRAAGAASRRGPEAGRAVTTRLKQAAINNDEHGQLAALQDLLDQGGVS